MNCLTEVGRVAEIAIMHRCATEVKNNFMSINWLPIFLERIIFLEFKRCREIPKNMQETKVNHARQTTASEKEMKMISPKAMMIKES